MIEFEDAVFAVALAVMVIGLGMIWLPLGLVVPGGACVGWLTWRRWNVGRHK